LWADTFSPIPCRLPAAENSASGWVVTKDMDFLLGEVVRPGDVHRPLRSWRGAPCGRSRCCDRIGRNGHQSRIVLARTISGSKSRPHLLTARTHAAPPRTPEGRWVAR